MADRMWVRSHMGSTALKQESRSWRSITGNKPSRHSVEAVNSMQIAEDPTRAIKLAACMDHRGEPRETVGCRFRTKIRGTHELRLGKRPVERPIHRMTRFR